MTNATNERTTLKQCIYCGEAKPGEEFSLEHIWPDALGGDHLPDLWRTNDVCRRCNNTAGVFVDGAFIRSFFTTAERAQDGLEYLSPTKPTGVVPLHYLGTVQNVQAADGEVADFWVCAPGANILHLRAASEEVVWNSYAGGDPRRSSKRSRAGRVLVSLTSSEIYWVCTALSSVKAHFTKAERFVTNLELPVGATQFRELDPRDPQQADDLRIVREFEALRERGERVHAEIGVALHADGRFLAKVALGVGYKLFGTDFLGTPYARELRKGFREADPQKRQGLEIRGSGYFRGVDLSGRLKDVLRWPGGWQLLLRHHADTLSLAVTSPSGQPMGVQVTNERALLDRLDPEYRDGVHWLTVPSAQQAVGPLPYGVYLAHVMGWQSHGDLAALDMLRGDPSELPPTGIKENEGS